MTIGPLSLLSFRLTHTIHDACMHTYSLRELLALKHKSRILGHSSNPVCMCGLSMMEQVRLCAVRPMENWLCSSLNPLGPLSENPSLVLKSKDLCSLPL